MRQPWKLAILLLLAAGSMNPTHAQEPGVTIPADLILARFPVNKGGDPLLVPVKIAGKERLFVVDTGCSVTIVDPALVPLGEVKRALLSQTASGEATVQQYAAPDGTIGGIPLGIKSVVGLDLKPVREALGSPIEGLLGMDFLKQHVVHVNFDRGELFVLKSAPENAGETFPLLWSARDTPELEARITPRRKVRLLIDTGNVGVDSGMLEEHSLKRTTEFHKVGSFQAMSASGRFEGSMVQGKRLSLGRFSVDKPVFADNSNRSALGLHFLSRFVATFDFPNQKMYLQKGKEYERPDLWDRSGLYWQPKDGKTVIDGVDDLSPASLSGFKEGDFLLTVGTRRIDEMSPYEIEKTLCIPGPLACTVRRGSQELRLTLNLPR